MPGEPLAQKVQSLMGQARDDLAKLVAMKSVADARQFPQEECDRAANYVKDAFTAAGIEGMRLVDMPLGHSAIYGHTPAPPGAPTVLLYSHYDVQPPLDESAWTTPVFELTEKDGRWHGRGSADCKGNIVAQLTALRALGGGNFPVGVKVIVEGSEEQGLGELEEWVPANGELLNSDAMLICDTANFELGTPTFTATLRGMSSLVVTVRTLHGPMHSGMFGGPAPDALTALIAMLATLHDADGNTTVTGLDNAQSWDGVDYSPATFRADARVLDGVDLIGSGDVAEMLWARPSVTVLGMDVPPVVGSAAIVHAEAAAKISLRVPPGMVGRTAQNALVAHLRSVAPWNVKVDIKEDSPGDPFVADMSGPAYAAMREAMLEAYGRESTTSGQGGSIPLCNILREAVPGAEIMLIGVEEPAALIHAPNESVDPGELERFALSLALFMEKLGKR